MKSSQMEEIRSVTYAEIDLDEVELVRNKIPSLTHDKKLFYPSRLKIKF